MTKQRESSLVFWLFLLPVLFAFIMIMVVPFFLGSFYAFTNWSSSAKLDGGLRFIGFKNFIDSFKDPSFIYSFGITGIYTVFSMVSVNLIAFMLALLVTSKIKLRNVYRAGFFVPNLIGGLILGYIWQFIFNNALPSLGKLLPFLGGFADPANLLLSKNTTAMLALVIVSTWQYAGYIMMIYIAAIANVPEELHEAAKIDGANA